jgi:methyl-accepting chemotaxis protein
MFNQMKVATRLALGFGLVIVLLLVLATLSIVRLGDVNSATRLIVKDRVPKVMLANQLLASTIDNSRQVRSMLLASSDAEADKLRERIQTSRSRNNELLATLDKMIASEKGRQLFKDIVDKRSVLSQRYDPMFALVRGDKAKANDYLRNEFMPANSAYEQALQHLTTFQTELMDAGGEAAEETYQQTRSWVLALSIGAVLAAAAVAFLITRNLQKVLGGEPAYAAEVMKKVAVGDFIVEVATRADDRSSLLFTTRQMVQSAGDSINDVVRVMGAMAAGRPDAHHRQTLRRLLRRDEGLRQRNRRKPVGRW